LISIPSLSLADDTIYTKVDENPVPLKTPPPRYPDSLRREGVAGVVAVTVVIDENGAIISSVVAKSSHPDFDKPALDAISKWKFKPGKKDGTPVKVKATLPLRFNLDE
jgi:protein TonB